MPSSAWIMLWPILRRKISGDSRYFISHIPMAYKVHIHFGRTWDFSSVETLHMCKSFLPLSLRFLLVGVAAITACLRGFCCIGSGISGMTDSGTIPQKIEY